MLGAFTLAALGACTDPAGTDEPGAVEEVGVIRWFESASETDGAATWPDEMGGVVIDAPDTVTAGEAFPVTVTTLGSSACWEIARTEVDNDDSSARIVPVDRNLMGTEGAEVCAAVVIELDHELTLTFTEVGQAVIAVTGREVVGVEFSESEEVTAEKIVTVQ